MLTRCRKLLPVVAALSVSGSPTAMAADCNCGPQPAQFAPASGGSFGSAGGSFGSAGGTPVVSDGSFGSSGGSFGSGGGSFGSAGGEYLPTGSSFGSAGGSFGSAGSHGMEGGSFGSSGGSFGSAGGSFGSAGGYPLSQGVLVPLDERHARIILNVPEAAVVYLGDKRMLTEGLTRSYLIPVAKPDVTYVYAVKIVVAGDTDVLVKVSEQNIRAGQTLKLDVAVVEGDRPEITVLKTPDVADEDVAPAPPVDDDGSIQL